MIASHPPNPMITKMPAPRRGAALAEAALILPVFLILILGMLDYGLATLNRNTLAAAAIRLGREASLHGYRSTPERSLWGPAAYVGTAAGADEVAGVVRPYLAVINPAHVQIRVEWLDGSQAVGKRVQVTLRHDQTPICRGLFGSATWNLQAIAVTRIQH